MALFELIGRGLRLRCPQCGRGRLFRTWFRMRPACEHCGVSFAREDGFFLGSIYVNYGLTGLIVAVVYPLLLFSRVVRNENLLAAGALAFVVLFPLWFFRYARSLWMALDQFLDPQSAARRMEAAAAPGVSSSPGLMRSSARSTDPER